MPVLPGYTVIINSLAKQLFLESFVSITVRLLSSLSPAVMEQFTKLATELEALVTADLDRLQEVAPSCHELIDNIRLNTSGHLSAMTALVQDKVRIGTMSIKDKNKFEKLGSETLVLVMGSIKFPNTSRSRARFATVWGTDHELNVARDNILPVKTRNNSVLLAILACLNQAAVIKFRKICIMLNSPRIKNIIESLDLISLQEYKDDSGNLVPDHSILKMIHSIMQDNKISLSFQLAIPDPPLNEIYYSFQQTARGIIDME